MTGDTSYRTCLSGDALLLVEFEARIDPAINARAVALATTLATARLPGVRDVLPTYATVAIHFDPLRTDLAAILAAIERHADAPSTLEVAERPLIEVPVCYGGAFGPDLDEVAAFGGCTAEDVIDRHSSRTYQVYMLGFVPGFAYLGIVDDRIAMPRRAAPRQAVDQGSVGIAGQQTGVYPIRTPGGWRIVGRTPRRFFDPNRASPSLVGPGDRVRFLPITLEQFAACADAAGGL